MKLHLFSILFVMFGFTANVQAAACEGNCPPPVEAFDGSASQTCPFDSWDLPTLLEYATCYYPAYAANARNDISNGVQLFDVRRFLRDCMCNDWRNGGWVQNQTILNRNR